MSNIISTCKDIIAGSVFLTSIFLAIFMFCSIAFIVYLVRLLSNIRAYIVNKSNSYYIENNKKMQTNVATLSMQERIDLTNSLLDLITFMITNEVASRFKSHNALNTPYNISDLDNDAKTISTFVFESIKSSIFTDANLTLTESYLSDYIVKKTIDVLVTASLTHNERIRKPDQNVGE